MARLIADTTDIESKVKSRKKRKPTNETENKKLKVQKVAQKKTPKKLLKVAKTNVPAEQPVKTLKRKKTPTKGTAKVAAAASRVQTLSKTNNRKKTKLDSSAECPPVTERQWPQGTLDRCYEEAAIREGYQVIVGVDEAGRGPLAGPVVAAACIVPADIQIEGINDSKKLNEEEREFLYEQITTHPGIQFAVSVIDHKVIDEVNILQATMRAMHESVMQLLRSSTSSSKSAPAPMPKSGRKRKSDPDTTVDGTGGSRPAKKSHLILVDGNRLPQLDESIDGRFVIGGDAKVFSIAAASIIAKVTRDRLMLKYDSQFPAYGFARHKGYGTAAHMAAIHKHGPCDIHRMTFAPLKYM